MKLIDISLKLYSCWQEIKFSFFLLLFSLYLLLMLCFLATLFFCLLTNLICFFLFSVTLLILFYVINCFILSRFRKFLFMVRWSMLVLIINYQKVFSCLLLLLLLFLLLFLIVCLDVTCSIILCLHYCFYLLNILYFFVNHFHLLFLRTSGWWTTFSC